MYEKSNVETYIIICKIDSQHVWLRKLKTGAMDQPRGMGREMGGSFKREGIYVYLRLICVEV